MRHPEFTEQEVDPSGESCPHRSGGTAGALGQEEHALVG